MAQIATQSGNVTLVQYLIGIHQVNWKQKNQQGYNALWLAVVQQRVEVVDYLLGVDANFVQQDLDKVKASFYFSFHLIGMT